MKKIAIVSTVLALVALIGSTASAGQSSERPSAPGGCQTICMNGKCMVCCTYGNQVYCN